MWRAIRALVIIAFSALAIIVPRAPASAGQSINPLSLNPPAFPPYTCMATGSGAICEKDLPPAPYGPSDNQLYCGTGANAFDTFDSGVQSESVTRYYDANLNVVRREIHYNDDGQWSNANTGASVPYLTRWHITDIPVVPGDLSSFTETVTGRNSFVLPHDGAIALDNGRITYDPNGDVTFASGRHDILAYVLGDASALQKLCALLGAT